MSILVYIESNQNQIKKSSFESLSYAKKLSKLISLDVIAVVINCSELAPLKKKVLLLEPTIFLPPRIYAAHFDNYNWEDNFE